jgi:hypothetical protein
MIYRVKLRKPLGDFFRMTLGDSKPHFVSKYSLRIALNVILDMFVKIK